MVNFKPLLAGEAPADLSQLTYPLFASPKLDGIRCVKLDGKALTRSLKPIPNDHIRTWIEKYLPDNIDGEIVLADDWTAPFDELSGMVRRKDGKPDFCFAAFDFADARFTFVDRFDQLVNWAAIHGDVDSSSGGVIRVVPHTLVGNADDLALLHEQHLFTGYEGTMLRNRYGAYKFGRSTTKEGILLKMKAFIDEDAIVYGLVEEMENTNEATTNALGRTERSTHAAGMKGKGRVGKLLCKFGDGTEFAVGSGLTDKIKAELWEEYAHTVEPREVKWAGDNVEARMLKPDSLITVPSVKIKHQPPPGGRPAGKPPRIPVFLGFRED